MKTTHISPSQVSPLRRTRRTMVMAVAVGISAFSIAGVVLPSSASAATKDINQCNGLNGSPTGATTGLTCTVTVVNTLDGAKRGSTTTVERKCTLGPCPGGNGTFTSKSTSLVTNVTQCNNSANDAAPPRITCRVNVTNNVSSNTPGAKSVNAATVNQCVGSGAGGGKFGATGPLVCDPFPATTTGATVTQCNGSVTGGGSTAVCSVASASKVNSAIPVKVNQCNGTGNKGGTLLTCSASFTNKVIGEETSTGTSETGNGTVAEGQVSQVPSEGVEAGGGSTAGLNQGGPLMLGGGLLLVAAMSALYGRRVARRH